VFVDSDGFILEGPNSNFALLTQDNVFVTPPFDNVLAGITVQRLMELIPGVRRDVYPEFHSEPPRLTLTISSWILNQSFDMMIKTTITIFHMKTRD